MNYQIVTSKTPSGNSTVEIWDGDDQIVRKYVLGVDGTLILSFEVPIFSLFVKIGDSWIPDIVGQRVSVKGVFEALIYCRQRNPEAFTDEDYRIRIDNRSSMYLTIPEFEREYQKVYLESLPSMSIETPSGAKVIFVHSTHGYQGDILRIQKAGLIQGHTYTVSRLEVGRSSSTVTLKEFPEDDFNTVHFVNAEPLSEDERTNWYAMSYGG